MMNVLVTGATGFVGAEVVRHLAAAGHRVRVLVRNLASPRLIELTARQPLEVTEGDVLDPVGLGKALAGVDAVVHLVGIIREVGRQTFERMHAGATGQVVLAMQRARVTRLVHMSALGTRSGAASRYHRTKWAAEELVRRSGLETTVFRPSIIYGPEDAFVNLFARLARRSPVMPVMGRGQGKLQPVPVGEVAACFTGALVEPRSIGQSYDLCGEEVLTFDQILDGIESVLGVRRWRWHVPMGLARAQAALMEAVFPTLLRQPPPLNRDQLIMLEEDHVGDGRPARELFRLAPVPFREGIRGYLKTG